MTDQSIAALIATLKREQDEQLQREIARELHRRGVSIVGLMPTGYQAQRVNTRVDEVRS